MTGADLHRTPIADCGHTNSSEQPMAITALLQDFFGAIDGS
ncbi:hypothetical protein AB0M12_11890 [Nocardia vinacea]